MEKGKGTKKKRKGVKRRIAKKKEEGNGFIEQRNEETENNEQGENENGLIRNEPKSRDRDARGWFQPGNKIGSMPKEGYTLKYVTDTIMEWEKTQKTSILEHFANRLKQNDRLLERFVAKYIPDKIISELVGSDGSPLQIVLRENVYKAAEAPKQVPPAITPPTITVLPVSEGEEQGKESKEPQS